MSNEFQLLPSTDGELSSASIFFESNKIPFTSLDPFNAHLKSAFAQFLTRSGLPEESVRLPKIFISEREVSIKRVHELAAKGLLVAILRG